MLGASQEPFRDLLVRLTAADPRHDLALTRGELDLFAALVEQQPTVCFLDRQPSAVDASDQRSPGMRRKPVGDGMWKLSGRRRRKVLAQETVARRRGEFDRAVKAEQDQTAIVALVSAIELVKRRLHRSQPDGPGDRHFDRLGDLQYEATNARIWGGIHYRTSIEDGIKIAKKTANQVLAHHFQRVRGHDDDHEDENDD